ncbi:MAG: LysM domain-containing protein, partial [Dysgonamonadaceae bacterium]
KKGDTLEAIARRNGTTVKQLCTLNNITTKTTLRIGRSLRIS